MLRREYSRYSAMDEYLTRRIVLDNAQIVSIEKVRSTSFEKIPVNYPQSLHVSVSRDALQWGLSTVLRRKLKGDVSGSRGNTGNVDSTLKTKLRNMRVRKTE